VQAFAAIPHRLCLSDIRTGVVGIIAVHLGLVGLLPRTRASLGLLALLGVAIAAVKYAIRRRRF
jgi:hypothetical protein